MDAVSVDVQKMTSMTKFKSETITIPDWLEDVESLYFECAYTDCECLSGWNDQGGPIFDPKCSKCHEGIIFSPDADQLFEKRVQELGGTAIDISHESYRSRHTDPTDTLVEVMNNKTLVIRHLDIDPQFCRYLIVFPTFV